TGAGLVATENLRNSTAKDWQFKKPTRLEGLVIQVVRICNHHPHHIYVMTRADLPQINYGANGPESYLLESWDDGENWRGAGGARTVGDIRWFALDRRDPDEPWVEFSRALVQIKRVPADRPAAAPIDETVRPMPDEPSLGQVVDAALKFNLI